MLLGLLEKEDDKVAWGIRWVEESGLDANWFTLVSELVTEEGLGLWETKPSKVAAEVCVSWTESLPNQVPDTPEGPGGRPNEDSEVDSSVILLMS